MKPLTTVLSLLLTLVCVFGQSLAFGEKPVIIENGLAGKLDGKKIILKPILTISASDEEDDTEKVFYRVNDIQVDKYGHIYVVEEGSKRVQKFDSTGAYLLTIGRSGQGPGEFQEPTKLQFDSEENIYVADFKNGTITRFSQDGTYMDSFMPEQAIYDFVLSTSDEIIILSSKQDYKFFKYDTAGNLISSFSEKIKAENWYDELIYNSGELTTDNKGFLYFSYLQPYVIDIYDKDDILRRVIKKDIPQKIIRPNTKIEKIEGYTKVSVNLYSKLSCSLVWHDGRIYHLVSDGQGIMQPGRYIDVFSELGEFLVRIDVEEPARLMTIDQHGYIYLFHRYSNEPTRANPSGASQRLPALRKYSISW